MEAEWQQIKRRDWAHLTDAEIQRIKQHFTSPAYEKFSGESEALASAIAENAHFSTGSSAMSAPTASLVMPLSHRR